MKITSRLILNFAAKPLSYLFLTAVLGLGTSFAQAKSAAKLPIGDSFVPAETTLEKIKRTGTIVIAHRESSIPFSYYDSNKQPIGYAVDLCNRLADGIKKHLGLKHLDVKYIAVSSASRIPAIVEGKADLECGSTTNNKERRDKVAFTIPHYIAGAKFLVKADSGIQEVDHLPGKTVITTKGTTTVKLVRALNDGRVLHMKIDEAPDHAAAFAAVESGNAHAFIMDDVLLAGLRANSANPSNTTVIGKFLSIEPYAIMLRKNDPEFKNIVDRTMANLVLDFEVDRLYKKWFMSPIPPKGINLNLPMNYLLRDSLKYPSDQVTDYVYLW